MTSKRIQGNRNDNITTQIQAHDELEIEYSFPGSFRGGLGERDRRRQHNAPLGHDTTRREEPHAINILVKQGFDREVAKRGIQLPRPPPYSKPRPAESFTSGAQRGASQYPVRRSSSQRGDVADFSDFDESMGGLRQRSDIDDVVSQDDRDVDVFRRGVRDEVSCGIPSRATAETRGDFNRADGVTSYGRQPISLIVGQQIQSVNPNKFQLFYEKGGSPRELSSRRTPTMLLTKPTDNDETVTSNDDRKRENASIGCIWSAGIAHNRNASTLPYVSIPSTITMMNRNKESGDDEDVGLRQSIQRSPSLIGRRPDADVISPIGTPSSGVSMQQLFT